MKSCLDRAKLGDIITVQWINSGLWFSPFEGTVIGFWMNVPVIGFNNSKFNGYAISDYSGTIQVKHKFKYALHCHSGIKVIKIKKVK